MHSFWVNFNGMKLLVEIPFFFNYSSVNLSCSSSINRIRSKIISPVNNLHLKVVVFFGAPHRVKKRWLIPASFSHGVPKDITTSKQTNVKASNKELLSFIMIATVPCGRIC